MKFSRSHTPLGSPNERFRDGIVGMLDGRLTFCVVSAVVLYGAPYAWTSFGPAVVRGLSGEGARWGGMVGMLVLWPVAAMCSLVGLWCCVLLLRHRAFSLLRLIGGSVCGAILWSMWRLMHH